MNLLTDKIYIISLKHRLDRRDSIVHQLSKIGAENYEFFDAIEGGAEGCRLSHKAIIEKAKELNLPYITILEDDALFCDDFIQRYNYVLPQLHDNWDMFYLGGNNYCNPLTMFSENIGKCKKTLSTVCYMIRDTIYNDVIELLNKGGIIDVIYVDKIQVHYKCYCSSPSLVSQIGGYSDIQNRNVDFYKKYLNLWQ